MNQLSKLIFLAFFLLIAWGEARACETFEECMKAQTDLSTFVNSEGNLVQRGTTYYGDSAILKAIAFKLNEISEKLDKPDNTRNWSIYCQDFYMRGLTYNDANTMSDRLNKIGLICIVTDV